MERLSKPARRRLLGDLSRDVNLWMRKSDLAHPLTGADDEHREALDTILRSLCDRTVEELVRDALNDELGDETELQD